MSDIIAPIMARYGNYNINGEPSPEIVSLDYYYSCTCLEISDWEAQELSNTFASPALPEADFQ